MSATNRPGRSAQKDITRRALVDAAASVFAEKGYRSSSVAEIAMRAGFTVGAVYSNFPNKRALFVAAFERQSENQLDIAWAIDGPVSDIVGLARQLLELDEEQRQWWLLWLESVIESQRNPENALPLLQIEASARNSLAKLLCHQRPGLENSSTLALALQAMWRGWLIMADDPDLPKAESFALSLTWLITGATQPFESPGST